MFVDSFKKLEDKQLNIIDQKQAEIEKQLDTYYKSQSQLEKQLMNRFDSSLSSIRYIIILIYVNIFSTF